MSRFQILGGTHLLCSPTFEYASEVWIPILRKIGTEATAQLSRPGFFPIGGGEIDAVVNGLGSSAKGDLNPIAIEEQGALKAVRGVALTANLPAHVPQRMAERARHSLVGTAPLIDIEEKPLRAACAGAELTLIAEFENITAGFTAIERRGQAAEAVADEAVAGLLAHLEGCAALDAHLADQVLLPLAFARGPSVFTCPTPTAHLVTNAWVIEQFGVASFRIEAAPGGSTRVTVIPKPYPTQI